MEIRKLIQVPENPISGWGLHGYETETILAVSVVEFNGSFEFSLREKNMRYSKHWETSAEEWHELNAIAEEGHSYGIYVNGDLAGWIICGHRSWNSSLYIEHILVNEKQRRQGAGVQLIKAAIREARHLGCRIIELETQNTNYPAIQFYRRMGFSITGINTRLYENPEETAVFMSLDL